MGRALTRRGEARAFDRPFAKKPAASTRGACWPPMTENHKSNALSDDSANGRNAVGWEACDYGAETVR